MSSAQHLNIARLHHGRQWCSTTASVCDDSPARISQDDFRPIPEAGSCRSISSVHYATVTATTTHHHCHVPTKMTIDSSHWHSSDSTDPSCDSVGAQCGMSQSPTRATSQHCPTVELATTAVVDPPSTNPINGRAPCFPDVLQSDREYSRAASEEEVEQNRHEDDSILKILRFLPS